MKQTITASFGSFFKKDTHGNILNPCNKELIASEYKQPINEVVRAYQSQLGEHLHSIYLRGSVPRGLAISAVADLDSLALIHGKNLDHEIMGNFSKKFEEKHPHINGLEIWILPLHKVNESKYIQFLIQTQSLCLWGPNIQEDLPLFQVDKTAYCHLFMLQKEYDALIKDIALESESERIESCQWFSKRVLRGGLELLMPLTGQYTRDLYPCYQLFSEHYPKQAESMYQILNWAINPISHIQLFLPVFEKMVQWLNAESKRITF